MGKLTRVLIGDAEGEVEETIPRLREMYHRSVQRGRQLARHAELAPHEAGQRSLTELAAEEQEQAEKLRQKVLDLHGLVGDAPPAPEPTGTLNYWGRLVLDLEAHRDAVQRLLELATELTENQPETADFLRGLAREEELHAERLRTLIARSDPQALN